MKLSKTDVYMLKSCIDVTVRQLGIDGEIVFPNGEKRSILEVALYFKDKFSQKEEIENKPIEQENIQE